MIFNGKVASNMDGDCKNTTIFVINPRSNHAQIWLRGSKLPYIYYIRYMYDFYCEYNF